MFTFARVAMRASMMGVTLVLAVAACLAPQTPFQHVTVALFIFLYCAIRTVGLSIIERSELMMQGAQHPRPRSCGCARSGCGPAARRRSSAGCWRY